MSLFNFFRSDPRKLFLDFDPNWSTWTVVNWNFDLVNPSQRRWTVEITKEEAQSIEWSQQELDEFRFFKRGKLIQKGVVPKKNVELKELMNLCFHASLKHSLESHHEFLLTPVSGATSIDYQNEARAQKWLEASFGTIMRALDQFQNRSDLILTAAFFSGLGPGMQTKVLRLLVFNLDIFCYFLEDFSLQLVVFDDKNLGLGSAKSPSFQQIIKVTKPQIYDEIVKLVRRIASVGEIR
jgi:hypothetical protein